MNKLRCWRESLKAANAARHTAEINARFSLREKNGRIYLICGSTAFAEIPKTTDAADIVSLLSKARIAATMFEDYSGN